MDSCPRITLLSLLRGEEFSRLIYSTRMLIGKREGDTFTTTSVQKQMRERKVYMTCRQAEAENTKGNCRIICLSSIKGKREPCTPGAMTNFLRFRNLRNVLTLNILYSHFHFSRAWQPTKQKKMPMCGFGFFGLIAFVFGDGENRKKRALYSPSWRRIPRSRVYSSRSKKRWCLGA